MSQIFVQSESRYPVKRKAIREKIAKILAAEKIIGEVEVSVVIVGDRKMRSLAKKFKGLDKPLPVLAFCLDDPKKKELAKKFPPHFSSPDDVLRLGDVVISYPQAIKLAAEEEKLVDQVIDELVEHGIRKLLGG